MMNFFEVSKEIAMRLTRIFLRNEKGRRPVYGGAEKFQSDPHWWNHRGRSGRLVDVFT